MFLNIVVLVVAIAGVVKGADWFLSAAEKVGVAFRLPPFILGVVLVGFGTSLPELATSIAAISNDVDNVTIANIAGSNIANVLLILGVSTIALGTIKFSKNLIDLDIPLLVGVTALFCLMIVDGNLGAAEAGLLLAGFVGYMIYSLGYKEESEEHHKGLISLIAALSKDTKSQVEKSSSKIGLYTVFILFFSIALLGIASKVSVDALLDIVAQVDVGVEVLTFFALAIGTSLPELMVSIKSLREGKGDIVIGNVIGSSMFNMLLIGGVAGVLKPQTIDINIVGWVIVGMVISVIMLMAGSISKRIHLWEGLIYILIYITIATNITQA